MDNDFWHKQTSKQPLFNDLLWSRPENKRVAGKLLIVGGNLYGFAAPAEAYQASIKAGIGVARVLLPEALQKTVGLTFAAGEYAPSTLSGSFSQKALAEILSLSSWADAVLVAGDLGKNAETAILLEKFAHTFVGQLVITKDAADYFTGLPQTILNRPQTVFVISLAQLQKLAKSASFTQPFTFGMDLIQLVKTLHEFTKVFPLGIIVKHLDRIAVATNGEVSTTSLDQDKDIWRVDTAAHAVVWWLQNPNNPFKALTTAVYEVPGN